MSETSGPHDLSPSSLIETWADGLKAALEEQTKKPADIDFEPAVEPWQFGPSVSWWAQDVAADAPASLAIGIPAGAGEAITAHLAACSGTAGGTLVHLLSKAVAGNTRSALTKLENAPQDGSAFSILVKSGATELGALFVVVQTPPDPDEETERPAESGGSRTMSVLLDVELPIRISLGRSRIPLKDVLKLTTGSVLELNRTMNDRVDVVVNNCVVARGELVVVDGNYGIRIQEINDRNRRAASDFSSDAV